MHVHVHNIHFFHLGYFFLMFEVSTSTPNQVRFHHSSSTSSIFVFFSSIVFVLGFFSHFGKNFHHRLQCIVAQFPIEFIWFCHFRENRKHSSRHWLSLSLSRSLCIALTFFILYILPGILFAWLIFVCQWHRYLYQLNHAGKLLVKCRLNGR